MTIPWHKAFRDFWQERARTVLVVLAIALGIAGFAAVLSSYSILTRALNEGYLATNPASATLFVDSVDDELINSITLNPAVAAAEARRAIAGRIKAGPAEWRNLTLFVVKDYRDIRVSTLKPERGTWPPALGELLIERDAFQVAKARIGDTVTIKTAGGKEQALRVTGSVHDVGQAQARMENSVYGYITQETLALSGETPSLDQLKVLVREGRDDAPHIRAVAEEVRKLAESKGHRVRRVDVPPPGKHPHAELMGLLLLALAAFGLVVLILSSVLVVNLLTALMASQIRQIGIMKALGGSRWQITRIYLGQALLLGAAAILVALVPGLWGGRLLCRAMAVFLNFDINSFAIPIWIYLLIAAVGLLVPLLAALWPVLRRCGVPVREALADHGVSRNAFGTTGFDRLLTSFGGPARPLLLALRNSFRRRTRLALTLLTLALGGLFFMSALNLRTSMIKTLDGLSATKKADLSIGFGTMLPFESLRRAARGIAGVRDAEGSIATEGSIGASTQAQRPEHAGAGLHAQAAAGGERFVVLALPPETALWEPEIVEGRKLLPGDTDSLVVNTALANKWPHLKAGSEVSFQLGPIQTRWRVVGISREPFSPAVGYIPLGFIQSRGDHAGLVNRLSLSLEATDHASLERVKAALEQSLEREGARPLSATTKADSRYGFDQHMLMIYVALIIMSCLIGGVGGLGLSTTMSLNVLERRREMGVLRAIGASPAAVWLMVVTEGAVIGLFSWALAALLAWPVSKALADLLVRLAFKSGLTFSFDLRGLFAWLAVSIVFAALSSFLPAWQAARCPVRAALAYE